MRILFVSHRVPYPPDKGEKIRAYHHVRHLARGHEVGVACLAEHEGDEEHGRTLARECAWVETVRHGRARAAAGALLGLLRGRPMSVAAYDSPAFRRRLRERSADFRPDAVVAYSAAMAPCVPSGIPGLLDFVDADSQKWRLYERLRPWPLSWVSRLEAMRLERFEVAQARRYDAVAFVSEAEAAYLRPHVPAGRIVVIPMGVDLDAFRPPEPVGAAVSRAIVFVGVMSYFPNADAVIHFASSILPRIRAAVPDASFHVVGRDPTRPVRALHGHGGVHVHGEVPDVRPYLRSAAVAVAPFRMARGVQSKVLEAMASGLPVVAAPVALQGLAATERDGIFPEDDPEAFAARVAALLRDEPARRAAGEAARAYVERCHRWEEHAAALERTLLSIVERARGVRP